MTKHDGAQPPDLDSLGAEIRQVFDFEQEDFPPLFLDTLVHIQEWDQVLARHERRVRDESILRRFFVRVGLDYAAYQRRRRQRHRRCYVVLLVASLALLVSAIFVFRPQTLEALRQPLLRWFSADRPWPTPIPPGQVTYYDDIAGLQPYFSVPLPQRPPAGFWPARIELNPLPPVGPRGSISYHREPEAGAPDTHGDTVVLLVWSLADEPFSFSSRAVAEPIEIGGQPAQWLRGGPKDRWVVWEQGPYKWALYTDSLSRQELLAIAEDFYGQISGH